MAICPSQLHPLSKSTALKSVTDEIKIKFPPTSLALNAWLIRHVSFMNSSCSSHLWQAMRSRSASSYQPVLHILLALRATPNSSARTMHSCNQSPQFQLETSNTRRWTSHFLWTALPILTKLHFLTSCANKNGASMSRNPQSKTKSSSPQQKNSWKKGKRPYLDRWQAPNAVCCTYWR